MEGELGMLGNGCKKKSVTHQYSKFAFVVFESNLTGLNATPSTLKDWDFELLVKDRYASWPAKERRYENCALILLRMAGAESYWEVVEAGNFQITKIEKNADKLSSITIKQER